MKTLLSCVLLTAVAFAFTGCEKKAAPAGDKPATEQKAPDAKPADEKPAAEAPAK